VVECVVNAVFCVVLFGPLKNANFAEFIFWIFPFREWAAAG
jgi:hypothetical protein